jgi:glycosyltransferase involved in cell wall biosynthesis
VVDDGSPDGAELRMAIASYGSEVTLLSKPNGGAASARNHGIDHATCPWVAFIDADDYWEADKLFRQFEVARDHPEVGLVGCRWFEASPDGRRWPADRGTERYTGRSLKLEGRAVFEGAMTIWTGSVMVRRDLLVADRFVSGLEPAEDRDLWIRLLARTSIFVLDDLLATYVQEPGGISRSNVDRDCGNMLAVVQRHANLLGPAGVRSQEVIVQRRWAGEYLGAGLSSQALPHALVRLRLQPFSLEAWWIACKATGLAARERLRPSRPTPVA